MQFKPVRYASAESAATAPPGLEQPQQQPLQPPAPAAAAGSKSPTKLSVSVSEGGLSDKSASEGPATPQRLVEALLIVKWGGVLTHAGRKQAEDLGRVFRMVMYPGTAGGGLLRLHSTYRHDFKIYSSDEGRVQTSAAAFTKGLLDLEGAGHPS